jgi:hypothetical protein
MDQFTCTSLEPSPTESTEPPFTQEILGICNETEGYTVYDIVDELRKPRGGHPEIGYFRCVNIVVEVLEKYGKVRYRKEAGETVDRADINDELDDEKKWLKRQGR